MVFAGRKALGLGIFALTAFASLAFESAAQVPDAEERAKALGKILEEAGHAQRPGAAGGGQPRRGPGPDLRRGGGPVTRPAGGAGGGQNSGQNGEQIGGATGAAPRPSNPGGPDADVLNPGGSSRGAAVDLAIRNAVTFLYAQQREDGSFRCEDYDKEAGPTALAVLALVSAGEAKTRPEIRKAVDWLRKRDVDQTYSLGLRAAALSQFGLGGDPARDLVLRSDVRKLMANMIDAGDSRGLYTYGPTRGNRVIADLSNSQYGVLGVWYAAEAGIEIPKSYWQRTEDAWVGAQSADGGYAYRPRLGGSYGSMTAAGIATLAITHDFLHASTAGGAQGRAAGRVSKSAASETRALDWLNRNFRADQNPGRDIPLNQESIERLGRAEGAEGLLGLLGGGVEKAGTGSYVHYMLFGYERVGEATGLTRFNGVRWFDAGSRFLLAAQAGDGSWQNGTFPGLVDTAYGVLFLSRGRSPVVVQKLEFEGKWNNRTRDAASMVRWLRRETERHVNWQIARLVYPIQELRESPVLYAASDAKLNIPEDQWHTLKQYLDEGGTLLCADEGKGEFSQSVEALFARLYPKYPFREIPPTHPFLAGNFPAGKMDVPVRALSNGIREIAVLLPNGDFPWRWQRTLGTVSGKSPDFSLVGNILVNVTGRASWRNKGNDTFADADPNVAAAPTQWRVARIQHGGNWDPEPLAWAHLGNILHNAGTAALKVDAVALTDSSLDGRYPLATLTATHVPVLSERERGRLRQYVEGGGVLLVEAAGGDAEVGVWAEELLRGLLPGMQIKTLPAEHPVYKGLLAGNGTMAYRPAAAERAGGRMAPPRLRGLFMGEKLLAVLATEDLTAGLVGYPHDGIVGYAPETARGIAENLLHFVHQR